MAFGDAAGQASGMCTLIAAVRVWPGAPLVVAANRDEFLGRPARPPFVWPGAPVIVAPRDDLAGGTWLGLNDRGLFVAVTNRAGVALDSGRRSRGGLVAEALRAQSAVALRDRLAGLEVGSYNPFHLFYADRETAHLSWSNGVSMHYQALVPGVHIITERSLGAGDVGREEAIRARWAREIAGQPLDLDRLRAMLTEHGATDPRAGTCVHLDDFGYGSRSSLLLSLGDTWAATALRWAEGRPCETEHVDQADLIAALAGAS